MAFINNGLMEVTVVGAKNLKNTEFFGRVDPYIVLEYKSQQQKSTICRGNKPKPTSKYHMRCCLCLKGQGTSPLWNEKFQFKVEYPHHEPDEVDNQKYMLLLKIMDHDYFTNDDYLGQATIYLKELFERGVENGKSELPIQKYRVVADDKTYQGEIQVGITFTTMEGTDEQ